MWSAILARKYARGRKRIGQKPYPTNFKEWMIFIAVLFVVLVIGPLILEALG